MPISFDDGDLIPLSEVPRIINPSSPPSIKSIFRWRHTGVRGVKLESIAIGGRVFTTYPAIVAFIEAQQGRSNAPGRAKKQKVAARAKRAIRKLRARGA